MHFPDGKAGLAESFLVQGVQEVALVFAVIPALTQLIASVFLFQAGIVSGGDEIGTKVDRPVEEFLEFDFLVADNVRIWCATIAILIKELLKYPGPVFVGEIDRLEFNAQGFANFLGVGKVFSGSAVFLVVILLPVFHKQAGYAVALFDQLGRRHR